MERKSRLLVIEDDPDVRDLVSQVLEEDILSAESPEELFKKLKENPIPSAILLNRILHGAEIAENILAILKSDERYKDIPVALFTATRLTTEQEERLRLLGITDFIYQPFDIDQFKEKVSALINDSRTSDHD